MSIISHRCWISRTCFEFLAQVPDFSHMYRISGTGVGFLAQVSDLSHRCRIYRTGIGFIAQGCDETGEPPTSCVSSSIASGSGALTCRSNGRSAGMSRISIVFYDWVGVRFLSETFSAEAMWRRLVIFTFPFIFLVYLLCSILSVFLHFSFFSKCFSLVFVSGTPIIWIMTNNGWIPGGSVRVRQSINRSKSNNRGCTAVFVAPW